MGASKIPRTEIKPAELHQHQCPECGIVWPCVMTRCGKTDEVVCNRCTGRAIKNLSAAVAYVTTGKHLGGNLELANEDQLRHVEKVRMLATEHNSPRPAPPFGESDFRTVCEKISAERGLPDLLADDVMSFAREACLRYNESRQ
jgi:hypothetical protein